MRITARTYSPTSSVAAPPAATYSLLPVTYSINYAFSAKERDTETGLSYFGARYYSSDLSIWLSVDPMSDKYPSLSPYVYCADNPVKLVDPNGEEVIFKGTKEEQDAAYSSLLKASTLQLGLKDGKLSAKGKPMTEHDEMLLAAINSTDVRITVYLGGNSLGNEGGGSFCGSTYDNDPDDGFSAKSFTAVNIEQMTKCEIKYGAPLGSGIIHEITEGYLMGLVAIDEHRSIAPAMSRTSLKEDFIGLNQDGNALKKVTTTVISPINKTDHSLYEQVDATAAMSPVDAMPRKNFDYFFCKILHH